MVSAVLLWATRPFKHSSSNTTQPQQDAEMLAGKVQLRGVMLLQLLAETFPRKLFVHWPAFFPCKKKPRRRNASLEAQTVLEMVCDAPNPKTRAAAVGVCVTLHWFTRLPRICPPKERSRADALTHPPGATSGCAE